MTTTLTNKETNNLSVRNEADQDNNSTHYQQAIPDMSPYLLDETNLNDLNSLNDKLLLAEGALETPLKSKK